MDMLIKRTNDVFDVVNKTEIFIGDTFFCGNTVDGLPIHRTITDIIETRPEKGIFTEKRPQGVWAKVKTSLQAV
jgi:hypothetical protein